MQPDVEESPALPASERAIARERLNTTFNHVLLGTALAAAPALLQIASLSYYGQKSLSYALFFIRAVGLAPTLLTLNHFLTDHTSLSPTGDEEESEVPPLPPTARIPKHIRTILRVFAFIAFIASVLWTVAGIFATADAVVTVIENWPIIDRPIDSWDIQTVIFSSVEGVLDVLVAALSFKEGHLFSSIRAAIPGDDEPSSDGVSGVFRQAFRKVVSTTLMDVWRRTMKFLAEVMEFVWAQRAGLDRVVVCLMIALGFTVGELAFYKGYKPTTWLFNIRYLHVAMSIQTYIFTVIFHRCRTAGHEPGRVVRWVVSTIFLLSALLWFYVASSFIAVAANGLFCRPYRYPQTIPCPSSNTCATFVMGVLELLLTLSLALVAAAVWKTGGEIRLENDSEEVENRVE